jgi:glycosyltransferase involved in cell wall biosynthesis
MKIAVIYHFFPHYRAGIFEELNRSESNLYVFVGSEEAVDGSIKTWIPPSGFEVVWTSITSLPFGIKYQHGLTRVVFSSEIDVLIFLGDAHYVSTWIYATLARMFGKKVFFWTHGWLRNDTGALGWIKDRFYRLANGLLLYGHHAKQIAIERGYPVAKLGVIYNSLNTVSLENLDMVELEKESLKIRYELFNNDSPIIICTARLTQNCRFDLLLKAATILKKHGTIVNVLLVGDGPIHSKLELLAGDLGIQVCFYGACYEERKLAVMLYTADVLVSPGKVGLSAMHALAYGTPVISHGDFDCQMPEFEAIVPGRTGDFFEAGNVQDLASKIKKWVSRNDREEIRNICHEVIRTKYNPKTQRVLIERSLSGLNAQP